MDSQQFKDLAKLARERTRKAVVSVAQLIEDDKERAALLVSIAADMLDGAATMLEEGDYDVPENEAFEQVFALLIASVGYDRVLSAIQPSMESSR
jgi:hypothetical protein